MRDIHEIECYGDVSQHHHVYTHIHTIPPQINKQQKGDCQLSTHRQYAAKEAAFYVCQIFIVFKTNIVKFIQLFGCGYDLDLMVAKVIWCS